jgi:hypothetical protein
MRYNLGSMDTHRLRCLTQEDRTALPIPAEVNDYGTMLLEQIQLLSGQIRYMDDYFKAVTVPDPLFSPLLTYYSRSPT